MLSENETAKRCWTPIGSEACALELGHDGLCDGPQHVAFLKHCAANPGKFDEHTQLGWFAAGYDAGRLVADDERTFARGAS